SFRSPYLLSYFPSLKGIPLTLNNNKLTKAGLTPAIANAAATPRGPPPNPIPICPTLLTSTPPASVAIPPQRVTSPK
ncbi:MAG: hypothetical protein Q9198_011298, partial [Flavoplaca austrocitrina]